MSAPPTSRHAHALAALIASALLLPAPGAAAMGAAGATAGAAGAPAARTSLPVIERQVMCVTCKIPLNVAQSPQADRERAFIQRLIGEGRDEGQIKQALVDQYGASVLGLPSAHGFDLTVYLVPIAALLVLLATLIVLLPRWRRHARDPAGAGSAAGAAAAGGSGPAGAQLAPGDAARLESDMARFD
jgi:cytochrome c-type biogenesis protein CcmH